MSKKVFVNDTNITLAGGVIMERANELHRFLIERLRELAEMKPAVQRVTIDLSMVTVLDACGCQLLALLVEDLKREGISPTTIAAAPVTDQIGLLGFGHLLATGPAQS